MRSSFSRLEIVIFLSWARRFSPWANLPILIMVGNSFLVFLWCLQYYNCHPNKESFPVCYALISFCRVSWYSLTSWMWTWATTGFLTHCECELSKQILSWSIDTDPYGAPWQIVIGQKLISNQQLYHNGEKSLTTQKPFTLAWVEFSLICVKLSLLLIS